MKKITLVTFLALLAFGLSAQLQLNTAPFANADHYGTAGVKVETVRTIAGPTTAADTLDIDIHWHWTPIATTSTGNGKVRNTGSPTVVPPTFFPFAGTANNETDQLVGLWAPAGDYLMPPQTVATRDGFAVRFKHRDGKTQDSLKNVSGYTRSESGYFSLGNGMNAGGDPVWFKNIADMKAYVTAGKMILSDLTYNNVVEHDNYGQVHDKVLLDYPNGLNTADKALVVVLPKTEAGDEALALYPGILKEIDLRFSFRSDRQQWTRDIEFDISTLDAGNTGKTATYDIIVSLTSNNVDANNPGRDNTDSIQLGETGAIVGGYDGTGKRWKVGTYVTGDPAKTVNVNEAMGLQPHELFNKTVVIALQTKGTEGDTDNESGTYDPVIAIDNIRFGGWNRQLDAELWALAVSEGKTLLPKRESTSVPSINGNMLNIVSSEYFDITGKKVRENTKGFLIIRHQLEDGSFRSEKRFVRER